MWAPIWHVNQVLGSMFPGPSLFFFLSLLGLGRVGYARRLGTRYHGTYTLRVGLWKGFACFLAFGFFPFVSVALFLYYSFIAFLLRVLLHHAATTKAEVR
jgi:nitrate reductase NapE component